MRQQIRYILGTYILKETLKVCPLMVLTLSCLSGGQVRGDSTFFPEGSVEAKANETAKDSSDAIKEWAELKPPRAEPTGLIPPKKEEINDISLSEPHASTPPEKPEGQKKPSPSIVEVTSDIQKAPPSDEQKSLLTTTATVDPKTAPPAAEPKPLSVATITPVPETPSLAAEQKPLKSTRVEPHPKALPVPENAQAKEQRTSQKTVVSYSDAANDRSPLGILDPAQEVHNQRWYIYSSAIRGLKNASDRVHIVCMNGTSPNRGEEVKTLLVDMGIEPEKIQLVHAKGEENQAKFIYIFAGK